METEVSFTEHRSTEEELEVHADWQVAPERFAECHLPGCIDGDQVIQGMSRQKDPRSRLGTGIDGGPGCGRAAGGAGSSMGA